MHAFWTGLMAAFMAIGAAAFAAEPPVDSPLRVGVFAVDATPPVGSPLAYAPAKEVTAPLSCRGVVLLGKDRPVVLCAVDWIGIGNDGQKEFRESLAEAAGTSPERVAVHALHQHCAPRCDFSKDRLLAQYWINDRISDAAFARDVIRRAAEAVAVATKEAEPATHLGLGQAVVEKVASNRRILGPDGKVLRMRWTSPRLGELRALPTGTIDPVLRMISLWEGDRPLVALSYYAVHPVSYSGEGEVHTEFPGIARDARQKATGVTHIHFTGAAGNLNASKWNDGSPENRQILADRVAAGMARAWESTTKTPIGAQDLDWESLAVSLPPAEYLDEKKLLAMAQDLAPPHQIARGKVVRLAALAVFIGGRELRVPRQDLQPRAVNRHGLLRDPYREHLPNVVPWHGIAVLPVGHEPLGIDRAVDDLHHLVGPLGQGNQMGKLFGVQVHWPPPRLPMRADVGHFRQPPGGHLVEVFQGAKLAAAEQVLLGADSFLRSFPQGTVSETGRTRDCVRTQCCFGGLAPAAAVPEHFAISHNVFAEPGLEPVLAHPQDYVESSLHPKVLPVVPAPARLSAA